MLTLSQPLFNDRVRIVPLDKELSHVEFTDEFLKECGDIVNIIRPPQRKLFDPNTNLVTVEASTGLFRIRVPSKIKLISWNQDALDNPSSFYTGNKILCTVTGNVSPKDEEEAKNALNLPPIELDIGADEEDDEEEDHLNDPFADEND